MSVWVWGSSGGGGGGMTHHMISLDLNRLAYWIENYLNHESVYHFILLQMKDTGCHNNLCVGSQIWPKEHPRSRPYAPPRPKDEMKEKAREYIKIYFESQKAWVETMQIIIWDWTMITTVLMTSPSSLCTRSYIPHVVWKEFFSLLRATFHDWMWFPYTPTYLGTKQTDVMMYRLKTL